MTADTLAGMSQAPASRAAPDERPGAPAEPHATSAETPPEADVAAMAAHLRVGVTRLARLLRRLGDTGLSPSQISALTSIERHGPLTLGALADHERVAPPSITKVVEKLVEAGLVVRVPDPVDRRVTRVSATPAGHALLDEVRARKDLWLASRLADLDPDRRDRLAEALDVIDGLTAWDGPA